ncbi:MAG TPA: nuclear transport factor 2 family protein [Ktedonobacteraceae bacterium]|nr:nuclear transport factor 2 family protein [Ktedonobacteraceae bacterium]
MDGQDNRLKLEQYLKGKLDAAQEYALRHEDVVIDMPQSGERIRGRDNMKAIQDAYPEPPKVTVCRIVGSGDVWVVEARSDYSGRIYHVANIIEFREGKIIRETRYYADPFEAPTWRAQWVEPIEAEGSAMRGLQGQDLPHSTGMLKGYAKKGQVNA